MGDDRLDRATERYEQAVFGGDAEALAAAEDELDSVEADLALARGRILHARFLADRKEDPCELALFERAVELYQRLGEVRGVAAALLALAELSARSGEPERAATLLAEAAAEAEGSNARGILRWIDAARAELAAAG